MANQLMQLVVSSCAAFLLLFVAIKVNATYLKKWSGWLGIASVGGVLGLVVPASQLYTMLYVPLGSLMSGYLSFCGARFARALDIPRLWQGFTGVTLVAWIGVLVLGGDSRTATALTVLYFSVGLGVSAITFASWRVHASARRLKHVVTGSLIALAVLYAFYPFASHLTVLVRDRISVMTSVSQLVFAVAVVTMHFNLLLAKRDDADRKVRELLSTALDDFIPICMVCHAVQGENGSWEKLEQYLTHHGGSEISHGVCPACFPELSASVNSL